MDLTGWFNFRKLYDLAVERLVADGVSNPTVVEVGTWKGLSIARMARQLRARFGSQFTLYAADKWSDAPPPADGNAEVVKELAKLAAEGRTLREVYLDNVKRLGIRHDIIDLVGDSAESADCFIGQELAFVFIDGDHTAEGVERDVKAWWPKARILAGHDLSMPSVREGLARGLHHHSAQGYYEMPVVDCWTTDKALADAVNAEPEGVFLATPMGSEAGGCSGAINAIIRAVDSRRDVNFSHHASSILPHNFNALLCEALNARESHRLKWFVMMHSDVIPMGETWLDDLLDLCEQQEADVLSVVLPIKDGNGLTSTAVDTDLWRPRRLTMTEIMDAPETFGRLYAMDTWGGNLLLNTGLMAFRLDGDWVEDAVFNFVCRIAKDDRGRFVPYVEPEDWRFSRWCNKRGLKLVATRKIPCQHQGTARFINFAPWGAMKTDEVNGELKGCLKI